ncbi:MAG TPA: 5-(carboxyamino)imidazole ribonucleotide synthase, partial [Methylomirabilota bacterium]|nr:5-(carboxyamino)imidazole ribonucleotide synthase [Methylomirabilota bacterium]
MHDPLPPGGTLGILGGGQLGRMLAMAAARLGLRVHVFCPDPESPAFDVSAAHTVAAYDDADALQAFADAVDVVTYEFENVPAKAAEILATTKPLRPDAAALATSQDRLAEKRFLQSIGAPVAAFAPVDGSADTEAAMAAAGLPGIVKTRRFGYDGKGQTKVATRTELDAAVKAMGGRDLILEGLVPFTIEVSAIVVRGADGETAVYDIGHNVHENHILKTTTVPAPIAASTRDAAAAIGVRIAEELRYVGVLSVEMFVVEGPAGEETLVVNEFAPRVHNSGHWTEDGAVTSQFENHVRAVAGWPLGSTARLGGATMTNLIGDEANDWLSIVADPAARLHLYGKAEARP